MLSLFYHSAALERSLSERSVFVLVFFGFAIVGCRGFALLG
jgi:hypothetical protein